MAARKYALKGIVSCYKGWLPTNEAIRLHALAINSNSQMHSIVDSSVSNVVFLSLVPMLVSMDS